MKDLSELEARLGAGRLPTLEQALTHSSYANERANNPTNERANERTGERGGQAGGIADNEQLEFLGDSVLGFVTAQHLFERYPFYSEAELHKLRAHIVSARHLVKVALELEIGQHLRLGRGEENSAGREKPALLVDALEAVIGAVFLDAGLDTARRLVLAKIVGPEIERMERDPESALGLADQKSALQQLLRSQERPEAEYALVSEDGPDHDKRFTVELRLMDVRGGVDFRTRAEGNSKKEAQRKAAQQALAHLQREQRG